MSGEEEQAAEFLQWDALPVQLIQELQEHSAEELLHKMQNILGFTNHRICIREAVLLQYYLSGFWWAKDTKFSPTQISFTMAVLHVLLENLREKQMSSVDNMVVFMKAMTAACHCAPSEENGTSLLNNNEAKALTCYVTKRGASDRDGEDHSEIRLSRCSYLTGGKYFHLLLF
ncbi:ciliary-associated calcium-binding coiled-coil protein 1 isoform X2 [Gambusia affinis]|uniref:ciliary-associated calcium-binding coiled-coil protein 1 isoform X2 n=1 Tax=Gambusia affinis TaxID=33528 RepID=UPI001CDC93BD|nr:ciliary-associated calcium-binding coiled-coil protein 1 isoform X2 [Gambusia affinis]